jgi:hypothetical protein
MHHRTVCARMRAEFHLHVTEQSVLVYTIFELQNKKQTNSVALSPRANYTD